MVKMQILPINKTIEVDPKSDKSVLDICLENHIHLDHACGANLACSTCHVKIKQGLEKFNEMDELEQDMLDYADDNDLYSRLGCQAKLKENTSGDVTIVIPEQKGLH